MKWKNRILSLVIALFLVVNGILFVYAENSGTLAVNGNTLTENDDTTTEDGDSSTENGDSSTEDGDSSTEDGDSSTEEDGSNEDYTNVDTVSPMIIFDLPESDGIPRDDGQSWYKDNKQLELVVRDEDSGISNIDFSVNDIEVLEDKNNVVLLKAAVSEEENGCHKEELHYSFDVDYFTAICEKMGDQKYLEEGKYEIVIAVTDHAGNVANHEAAFYIDKVPPTVAKVEFIPEIPEDMEGTEDLLEEFAIDEFTYGYYFKTNYRVIATIADAAPSSGLAELKYCLESYQEGEEQEDITGSLEIMDGKAELEIPEGFRGRIFADIFDCVGNSLGAKLVKAEDKNAPVIDIIQKGQTNYQDADGNSLYTEGNSFTVKITDIVSGIRELGYQQSAEKDSYARWAILLDKEAYNVGEDLGDGWLVTGIEENLVTQVTKTFDFTDDDNHVTLTFDAKDNSENATEPTKSESFTVDRTPPTIKVEFEDDRDTFHKQSRVANITVTERNFNVDLIEIAMENTSGDVPAYAFEEKSPTEHVAVIDFGEGDYTFSLEGRDLGNLPAEIVYIGNHTDVFCIDKTIPDVEITEINGNFHHEAVKADVTISDSRSGIAKVEYLWDDGFWLSEGDLRTDYVEFMDYVDGRSEYVLILPWDMAKRVPGNKHTLHLRVTDKAGNVYDDVEPVTDPIGSDMLPPQFESIEIRKPQSDKLEGILKFFSFGTFYKNKVEVVVKANDNETEEEFYASGVKSVMINNEEAVLNAETNEYVLTVRPDNMMQGMRICVEDNVGLVTKQLATEIPERGKVESNDLIIEDNAPVIDFGNILLRGHKDDKGHVWFGKADSDLEMKITAADCLGSLQSGLYSVTIKDNGQVKYSNTRFPFKTTKHTEKFRIGDLSNGEHIFTVEVEDNCGNIVSDSITFYKDTNAPKKGTVTVVSPESVKLGAKHWFDKEEVITFRVDTEDTASGLKNISLDINGKSFRYAHDEIESDEEGCYILADTAGMEPDEEHKYTITGTATDFAHNELKLQQLAVHIDFEEPTIERFTVQKKSSTLDKILKVLSFGIFSNDTLIFKAYTKDMDFDSGIDYATVQFTGVREPVKMLDEGSGVFSVEIPVKDMVFESDIIVKVYDRDGKVSLSCPNISDVKGELFSNGKLAMIETDLPIVAFSLPPSDSIPRDDEQIWYRSNRTMRLSVHDKNSGINNVDLSVNGVEVLEDKKGNALLKTEMAEAAIARNNDIEKYIFDANYFSSICGAAQDGKYVLAAQTTDNAGNAANIKAVYYMDEVSPTIDRIDFLPKTSDGIGNTAEFMEEMVYGYYFKTAFKVIVNVSDAKPSSGLHEVRYRMVPYQNGWKQEEISGSQKIADGKATIDVPKGFKGQIFVEAFDYVLNSSGEKTVKAFVVDSAAPDIKITKNVDTEYHDADGNSLYVRTNRFTVLQIRFRELSRLGICRAQSRIRMTGRLLM